MAESPATSGNDARLGAVRDAIVRAVIERIGAATSVDVEVLQAADTIPELLTATPASGARLGEPVRFVLTAPSGVRLTAVARVTAVVEHVVATRPLARDVTLTPADLERRQSRIDGVPLERLPTIHDVVASRTRRDMVAGEVFSRAVLARPYAVRAGDTVAMTIRSGRVEARGVGRAVSSGFVGDVIRITRPGSRQPSRARVVAAAAVEILQ